MILTVGKYIIQGNAEEIVAFIKEYEAKTNSLQIISSDTYKGLIKVYMEEENKNE